MNLNPVDQLQKLQFFEQPVVVKDIDTLFTEEELVSDDSFYFVTFRLMFNDSFFLKRHLKHCLTSLLTSNESFEYVTCRF